MSRITLPRGAYNEARARHFPDMHTKRQRPQVTLREAKKHKGYKENTSTGKVAKYNRLPRKASDFHTSTA